MLIATFFAGLVLLVGGAELLVRGASRVATAAGVAPVVVGLTVVAFGTSAPELAVSSSAALQGDAELALGNVIGSNITNVLLILGAAAAVVPLDAERRLIRIEVPFLILISVGVLLLAIDGLISRPEGALLLAVGLLYCTILVIHARRTNHRGAQAADPRRTRVTLEILLVILGLALLILGSRWLVAAARGLAESLGISELVIGLTVVAIGTSLPELATSMVAGIRGERDMAVGSVIGSNLFNLLVILGIAALLSPGGVVVPVSALTFDLPVMVAAAVVCLPIFLTGRQVDRGEGLLFLGFYAAYTAHLILDASSHHALPQLRQALLYFAFPLTAVTLLTGVIREIRSRR
jgi:cation:H+ antiporter